MYAEEQQTEEQHSIRLLFNLHLCIGGFHNDNFVNLVIVKCRLFSL